MAKQKGPRMQTTSRAPQAGGDGREGFVAGGVIHDQGPGTAGLSLALPDERVTTVSSHAAWHTRGPHSTSQFSLGFPRTHSTPHDKRSNTSSMQHTPGTPPHVCNWSGYTERHRGGSGSRG